METTPIEHLEKLLSENEFAQKELVRITMQRMYDTLAQFIVDYKSLIVTNCDIQADVERMTMK